MVQWPISRKCCSVRPPPRFITHTVCMVSLYWHQNKTRMPSFLAWWWICRAVLCSIGISLFLINESPPQKPPKWHKMPTLLHPFAKFRAWNESDVVGVTERMSKSTQTPPNTNPLMLAFHANGSWLHYECTKYYLHAQRIYRIIDIYRERGARVLSASVMCILDDAILMRNTNTHTHTGNIAKLGKLETSFTIRCD